MVAKSLKNLQKFNSGEVRCLQRHKIGFSQKIRKKREHVSRFLHKGA